MLIVNILTDEIRMFLNAENLMNVNIDVFDVQGRKVMNLYNGIVNKEHYINAKHSLPSGVYFVKCGYDDKNIIKKIKILK